MALLSCNRVFVYDAYLGFLNKEGGAAVRAGYKQTEAGVIPEDWEVKAIGQIAPLQRGFDLPTALVQDGPHPVVYSNGVMNHHDHAMARGPGVVTGRSGTIGRVHFVDSDYWPHNTSLWVTRFNGNDPRFIYYLFCAIGFERFASGSGVPTLNRNDAHAFQAALPPTKAEQEAIAEALGDADALIESLERLLAKKRQLKQGAMQELLTGKRRLPGFEVKPGYKQTEVGVIPEDWEVTALGKLANLYQPVTISAKQLTKSGFPVYGANGVVGFYSQANHHTWQVTVTCRGSTCGTVNRTVNQCWITGNAMVMNCDQSPALSKEFFYHLLHGQDLSDCITGTGQPQIVRSPLAAFSVPVPPFKAEQEAIAAILFDMDDGIDAIETKLSKTRHIKRGMMQELLTGRIRLV